MGIFYDEEDMMEDILYTKQELNYMVTDRIVRLSGIKKSKFFTEEKELKKIIAMHHLRDHTDLYDYHPVSIKDELFRTQFYCCFTSVIINHIDEILKGYDKERFDSKANYLDFIYTQVDEFQSRFLTGKKYHESLLELYIALASRKVKGFNNDEAKKACKLVAGNILNSEKLEMDNVDRINEILRLIYSISTNSLKYPKYLIVDDYPEDESEVKEILSNLGKAILTNWEDTGARPMFVSCYCECEPVLDDPRFKKLHKKEYLKIGYKLLIFIDLLLIDKKMKRVLHHLIY